MSAICARRPIDCITSEEIASGFRIIDDGEYEWCDFLAYHITKYNIKLPESFIDKVEATGLNNGQKMPYCITQMDRTDDRKFKDVIVSADSIISFFETPSNTDLTLSDWKLLEEELDRWFLDPRVSDEEKWKVRLSGYMEMVSMVIR